MPDFELADGARLHVEERPGEGVPVVLVHGILSSSASWRLVADRLEAAGRRVLMPDDRGHGASEPRLGAWGPEVVATDLVDWLSREHPEGVHLVGHSRGATAASWVAHDEPHLVRSLGVIASPPQATEVFRATFRKRLEALAPDAPLRVRRALDYLSRIPDDAFPGQMLRRYQGPALVIECEDDPLYSPVGTMFWRLFLPYADFERVPGDHDLHETEAGAEWVSQRLLRHVESAESGDVG